MLRVISRPMTVPAERIALLKAGLSITLSNRPGSGAGAGMGGISYGGGTGGRSAGGAAGGGGANRAASRS